MIQRLLSLTPLLLLSLTPCLAQEAPTLSTTGEEVVVTGARYARTLAESPDKVTVIDSATIARSPDLGQLLQEQAGIVVNGAYANPGKDRSLFLRNGANQYNPDPGRRASRWSTPLPSAGRWTYAYCH